MTAREAAGPGLHARTPRRGRSVILTCDIDEETVEVFGGPVWHVSVCPPVPGAKPRRCWPA